MSHGKSIEHWEAMKQRFAQHPEEVVEYVRELVRQANDLEDENAALRRQVEWLAQELARQGYAFTAEDWMKLAKEGTKNGEVENGNA